MGKFNSETRQVKEALHFQMTPSEECFNWLLDHCDEEAGKEEQSSLTFDLQRHVPQWCMAISSNVCLRFSF